MDERVPLAELLERCAKSTPPDYYEFYTRVHEIISGGAPPRSFCQVFAAELKAADDRMRGYSDRGERGEKLSRDELLAFKTVFHKLKLLNGCAEKLPSEMRKLISQMSGCPVMGL